MWASGADIKLLHQGYTSKQGKASLKCMEEQLPWLEQRGKKWEKKKLSIFPSKTVKSLPLLSAWIALESRHCVSSHTCDFCLLNKRQVWNNLGNFILQSLGSGSTQQKVNWVLTPVLSQDVFLFCHVWLSWKKDQCRGPIHYSHRQQPGHSAGHWVTRTFWTIFLHPSWHTNIFHTNIFTPLSICFHLCS